MRRVLEWIRNKIHPAPFKYHGEIGDIKWNLNEAVNRNGAWHFSVRKHSMCGCDVIGPHSKKVG